MDCQAAHCERHVIKSNISYYDVMMNIFDDLNFKQQEAVKETEGYLRVTAGAGSGKTRVIAHRFAYMVNELGISPGSILCITFTNKAAREMRNRIESLIGEGRVGDFVCTYHSFCLKFLREEIYRMNLANNFNIMDESDSLDILKEIYPELGLTATERKYKNALTEIREAKKNFPNYVYYFDDKEQRKPTYWSRIFSAFVTRQRKYNMLDYDDLIYFTLHILNTKEGVLDKWSNRINYIMVDEAQDSNRKNWDIVNKLSEINKNLCAVGDPDQAIYGWRGARVDLFVEFPDSHSPCKDVVLDINYRSFQEILTASDNLIKNNLERVEKEMTASRGKSSSVVWHHALSESSESGWICKKIEELKASGDSYNEMAVLYRSNYSSRYIEQAFMKHKIPYAVYGGIRFFERTEIKAALSYLSLIEFGDDFAFMKCLNTPKRGLGPAYLNRIKDLAEKQGRRMYDAMYENIQLEELRRPSALFFCKFINECRKMKDVFSVSDMMEYVIDESGLRQTLKDDGDEDRMNNLKELVVSAKLYEEYHAGENISLESYLQDMALFTNMDYKKDIDCVKIMTIHQSKGLEFKNVFVCNLSEGSLPNYKALRDGNRISLEEERRIMYVAMTRAKDRLFLTDSCGYNSLSGDQKVSSRFIHECGKIEIDKESAPISDKKIFEKKSNILLGVSPKFSVGDCVIHPLFGYGNITNLLDKESCYEILFDGCGVRKVRYDFGGLEK